MTGQNRVPLALPVLLVFALAVLPPGCGNGKAGGGQKPPDQGESTGGNGTGETPGLRHGEIPDDAAAKAGKTASTVTPGELRRMTALIEDVHLAVRINDFDGFFKHFLEFAPRKNILVKAMGEEKWKARPENAGPDDIERKKSYRKWLKAFFEALQVKSKHSELTRKEIRETDGVRILYTDTVYTEHDKNMIVLVAGLAKDEEMRALLRLRISNYRNQVRVFCEGRERIVKPASCGRDVALDGLRRIASLETAFAKAKHADLDKDATGEYAFLAELFGLTEVRSTTKRIPRPDLPVALLEVSEKNGIAYHKGWLFRVYLSGVKGFVAADDCDGFEKGPVTDGREKGWCCFAWPVSKAFNKGTTLVMGSDGKLYENKEAGHEGLDGFPKPEDAYADGLGGAVKAGWTPVK